MVRHSTHRARRQDWRATVRRENQQQAQARNGGEPLPETHAPRAPARNGRVQTQTRAQTNMQQFQPPKTGFTQNPYTPQIAASIGGVPAKTRNETHMPQSRVRSGGPQAKAHTQIHQRQGPTRRGEVKSKPVPECTPLWRQGLFSFSRPKAISPSNQGDMKGRHQEEHFA